MILPESVETFEHKSFDQLAKRSKAFESVAPCGAAVDQCVSGVICTVLQWLFYTL